MIVHITIGFFNDFQQQTTMANAGEEHRSRALRWWPGRVF